MYDHKVYMKEYRQRRKAAGYYDEHRKELNDARREYARRCKKIAFDILGNKCARCGFADFRALQVDHLNGGGNKERRSHGHETYKRYKNVIDRPDEYQLLCANCNWIKHYEKREGHRALDPKGDSLGNVERAGLNLETIN